MSSEKSHVACHSQSISDALIGNRRREIAQACRHVIEPLERRVLLSGGTTTTALLNDQFTSDTTLNSSLWTVNGSAAVNAGSGLDIFGDSQITPSLSFSSAGMQMSIPADSNVIDFVQSNQAFQGPFTATTQVEGTQSSGNTFVFMLTNASGSSNVEILGNLNPSSGFTGISWRQGGSGPGPTLVSNPSVNVLYGLTISVDASGDATLSVASGGQSVGAVTTNIGSGPFYLALGQYVGTPFTSGPNVAVWQNAEVDQTVATDNVTVNGNQGPWQYANGGLNTTFQYGFDDQTGPTVISASDGFDFTAGDVINVSYLSGIVSTGVGSGGNILPSTDANGDTASVVNNQLDRGMAYPSYYFDSATYPAYLGQLVGTFTDGSGAIVGTPFVIGDSASLTISTGATQLQLGVNDDVFSDNTGSWQIQVSEQSAAAVVPSATITTPSGTQSGDVTIDYTLTDANSDPCSILAQYSADGGATWSTATQSSGGDGTIDLSSSASGTAHTFVWNSTTDLAGVSNSDVEFRITPTAIDGTGPAASSGPFTADNATTTPSTPTITSVTAQPVSAGSKNWTFTITGNNLGAQSPFNGTNPDISIMDETAGFEAGHTGDRVKLDVTGWNDSQIKVAGYSGLLYGSLYTAKAGDSLLVTIDNPNSGQASNAYSLVLPNTVPTSPGAPAATSLTPTAASVTWNSSTDPYGEDVTYQLQYQNAGGRLKSWTNAGQTSGTTLLLTKLRADTTYNIRVRATDSSGLHSNWTPGSFETLSAPTGSNFINAATAKTVNGNKDATFALVNDAPQFIVFSQSEIYDLFNSMASALGVSPRSFFFTVTSSKTGVLNTAALKKFDTIVSLADGTADGAAATDWFTALPTVEDALGFAFDQTDDVTSNPIIAEGNAINAVFATATATWSQFLKSGQLTVDNNQVFLVVPPGDSLQILVQGIPANTKLPVVSAPVSFSAGVIPTVSIANPTPTLLTGNIDSTTMTAEFEIEA